MAQSKIVCYNLMYWKFYNLGEAPNLSLCFGVLVAKMLVTRCTAAAPSGKRKHEAPKQVLGNL
jgi:hypothetical protein